MEERFWLYSVCTWFLVIVAIGVFVATVYIWAFDPPHLIDGAGIWESYSFYWKNLSLPLVASFILGIWASEMAYVESGRDFRLSLAKGVMGFPLITFIASFLLVIPAVVLFLVVGIPVAIFISLVGGDVEKAKGLAILMCVMGVIAVGLFGGGGSWIVVVFFRRN